MLAPKKFNVSTQLWFLWFRRYQGPCFEKHCLIDSSPFVSHLSAAVWNAVDHPLITDSVLFFFYSITLYN